MPAATKQTSILAKPLAPDDLRSGEYVCILSEVIQVPSFLWCCDNAALPPEEPVEINLRAQSFQPLKVLRFCLPMVLAKLPCGCCRTLDIRACQLARLDPIFAKQAIKALKKQRKGKRARCQCQER